MRLADLETPRTPACPAALEVARAYCSPGLFNHSVRAYLWAAEHALSHGIGYDAELLYVTALSTNIALGEMVSQLFLEKCRRGFEPAQMAGLHEHD
jgi:hypothetical protein